MTAQALMRRLSTRYPCRVPAHIVSLPARKEFDGEIINISFGGALLKVNQKLGTEVVIEFYSTDDKIALAAYVIRDNQPPHKRGKLKNYGIEFHTYGGQEERFRAFLNSLGEGSDGQ